MVNFSDGNRHDKFRVGLHLALKKRFPEIELPELSAAAELEHDHCWRFVFRKLDLLEMVQYLDRARENSNRELGKNNKDGVYILPDAQWCIASSENGVGMACKGGHNGEPHNHNDVGHFLYEAKGSAFLADLGAGEYNRDYFGERRYEILCNSSFGHSVPILSGRGQKHGREYGCSCFEVKETLDQVLIHMDLSGAYGVSAGKILRKVLFSLSAGSLTVVDRFSGMDADTVILENLITQCRPVAEGNRLILIGDHARTELTGFDLESMTIVEHSHRNHQGKTEKVYAIQWKILMEAGESSFYIRLLED